jgi:GcrA cell cycle regulator
MSALFIEPPWPAKDDELTRLWAQGYSTAVIGHRLGVTKNAVIGRARRLKLTPRPNPVRADQVAARAKAREEAAQRMAAIRERVEAIMPQQPEPAPRPVAAAPIFTGQCKWPLWGDEKPTHAYCGGPAEPGKPYCAEHCARAYTKPKPPQEATKAA